jgi:hypothetical protein
MRHCSVFVLLFLILTSPTIAHSSSPVAEARQEALWFDQIAQCVKLECNKNPQCSSYLCIRQAERGRLDADVSRGGTSLTIRLKNGSTRRFSDSCLTPPEHRQGRCFKYSPFYAYVGYVPSLSRHLVHVNLCESAEYLLISSDNGKGATLRGWPILSPDGKSVVATSVDLVAGFSPNGLEVWTLKGDALVKELRQELSWGAKDPRWLQSDVIEVTKVCVDPNYQLVERGMLRAVRRDGRWTLPAEDCPPARE